MPLTPLQDFLDEPQRVLVLKMIEAIVDHPDKHVNIVRIQNVGAQGFTYFVGQQRAVSAIVQYQRLAANITTPLRGHGWMDGDAFTDEALTWYRENRVTDAQIRERLGRFLYERFEQQPDQPPAFDLETVAELLGVPVGKLDTQARLLVRFGYADRRSRLRSISVDGRPSEPAIANEHLYHLHLSDEGLKWAAAGYPDVTIGTSITNVVNVDIRVAITNTINQARESDIDPDLLLRWEALMRRLEEELEKPAGQGSFQVAKDVIQTAESSRSLLGHTVKLFSEQWDRINGLIEAAAEGVQNLPMP